MTEAPSLSRTRSSAASGRERRRERAPRRAQVLEQQPPRADGEAAWRREHDACSSARRRRPGRPSSGSSVRRSLRPMRRRRRRRGAPAAGAACGAAAGVLVGPRSKRDIDAMGRRTNQPIVLDRCRPSSSALQELASCKTPVLCRFWAAWPSLFPSRRVPARCARGLERSALGSDDSTVRGPLARYVAS